MALGLGAGGGEAAALGTAVIGGLAASTLAALVFVPPLYRLIARRDVYRSPFLDPDDPERSPHAADLAAAAHSV